MRVNKRLGDMVDAVKRAPIPWYAYTQGSTKRM